MDRERWRKIESLCNSALDLEPDRREAFLVEASAGDESLLRDVRLLLDMQPEAENFIESPALERIAKRMASESEKPNEFTSMTGKMLGHYQVGEGLGRGGMGDVYLANDLSLDRKVALKFLPKLFTGDREWMSRFEREAKLLASLNHPNIAVIHGIEEAEGKRFLVLEVVEGETLEQRLSNGQLAIEESLRVCRQIAQALEAAHEKGVIHRDLKPANIMVSSGGDIKLLDFGLAKTLPDETRNAGSPPHSPAIEGTMTEPGMILGTAAYMSPEQAKGRAVDRRADIWALGCVLYECLTGKRAFDGDTVTEILAAILKSEPDWQALPPATPVNIRFALRRCLEKEASQRFHHAADLRIQLTEKWETVEPKPPLKRPWMAWIWAVLATLLAVALGGRAFFSPRPRESPEAARFQITVPPMPDEYYMAISPDGRAIAYVASPNASSERFLFVREIDSIEPRQISGTEGALHPFWSPDSRSIAFYAHGRLKRVDSSGGFPKDLCAVTDFRGGTWNREGLILFGEWPVLRRVSSAGGEPVSVTRIDESAGEHAHYFPFFLPDGRHYLYEVRFNIPSKTGIYVGCLDSPEKNRLLTGESMAAYAEPGYLLFQKEGTLYAQPFDAKKGAISGEPVPIVDNVAFNVPGWAGFSASQTGTIIYRAGNKLQFMWFDRTGKPLGAAGQPEIHMSFFDLSPDGTQIAMRWREPTISSQDIWLMDVSRDFRRPLTEGPSVESYPVWSDDGQWIAFASFRKGNGDILKKRTDGIGEESVLLDSPDNEYPQAWSKDGNYLAYVTRSGSKWSIHILPLFGDRKPFPIIKSFGNQWSPSFSFDDRWLAYGSDDTGKAQIYLTPFPVSDRKYQVSNNGGWEPRWRSDGKELYYFSLDGKIMAVDVAAGKMGIESGTPRVLFETKINFKEDGSNHYEVTPDGQRFLLLKPVMEGPPTPITVVLNWLEELKQRVPVKS